MKQFGGFPAKMQFTSVPNLFFSTLLPHITDIAELKTTLHIFEVLYRKQDHLRFVTYGELLGNASLISSLRQSSEPPQEALRHALELAAQRGTIFRIILKDEVSEDIYFLNTEANRQIAAKIQNGELNLNGLKIKGRAYIEVEMEEQPDIFTLYEQNIGMLTPTIADELREAEKLYPEDWIKDAIKESVNQNKRKWSYISAILERWSAEGKNDGTYRRNSTKSTDPDKYIKGKYGHTVRR